MTTTIDQRTNREHAAQVQETLARAQRQGGTSNEVAAINQRIAAAEQNIEKLCKHFFTLQADIAGDLCEIETNLKAQGAAIDSARTATAQTDDLLERVVAAFELLQSSIQPDRSSIFPPGAPSSEQATRSA